MIVTRVEHLEAAAPGEAGGTRIFAFDVAASWQGTIDPASGMVVNLAELKDAMRRRVVAPAAGRMLDGAMGRPLATTPEVLARWVWSRLDGAVPGAALVRVVLDARPRLVVTCSGGGNVPIDVTRVYEFSASHRLHAPALSAAENQGVFGKCNNPEGHGHNYVLEATIRGEPGPSGQLAPAEVMDRIVKERVVDRWDHKNLNRDLPEFEGVNPTAEEIVRIAWTRLSPALEEALPKGVGLHRLKLLETARNHVEYEGDRAR